MVCSIDLFANLFEVVWEFGLEFVDEVLDHLTDVPSGVAGILSPFEDFARSRRHHLLGFADLSLFIPHLGTLSTAFHPGSEVKRSVHSRP